MAISQHWLKNCYSITSLNGREFLSFNSNYVFTYFPKNGWSKASQLRRRYSDRASFSFLEEISRKFWIIIESRDSIESRDETPARGLEQVGRNDPSDIVSEGPTTKKGEFELPETSWDLESVLVGCANKYMDNSDSRQTLIYNETMSFNPVPENMQKGKILDLYLRDLLAE